MIHAAVGILIRDKKLLIAERPPGKSYSGYWEFPGGKIEVNESGSEALTRELREELGIEVISARPWFEFTYTYPDKTVFLEMWRVDQFTGEPRSMENQTLRWAALDEMHELRLLAAMSPILDRIKEVLE